MPTRGYYSLIQFCPDTCRLEVANVGVVLYCPEVSFLISKLPAATTEFGACSVLMKYKSAV